MTPARDVHAEGTTHSTSSFPVVLVHVIAQHKLSAVLDECVSQ